MGDVLFEKRMYDIKVSASNECIRIESPDYGDGVDSVYIPVEQVDIVIQWLQEAKEVILKQG